MIRFERSRYLILQYEFSLPCGRDGGFNTVALCLSGGLRWLIGVIGCGISS